jgi:hypothetical protein
MPLDRVPGHRFDAPVDHADGRRGRLPMSGAVAQESTHGGMAQRERTVAAVPDASRGVGERAGFGLGNAGASAYDSGRKAARTRSSRPGPLQA